MPKEVVASLIGLSAWGGGQPLLADDKGIKLDMPAWCRATGHEFLGVEEEGGEIKVYVKKAHE